MKNWIKKTQRKLVAQSGLLIILIFTIVMIPMVIENADTGDYEVAIASIIFSCIITVFILLISLGLNTLKANKLIKAQEALGINFEDEPLEEEKLETCSFSGDWFLYHKNEVLAFHRNYIDRVEEGKVKNGKYYTTGIHLYGVDGKKYGLVVKKTYMDEVVLRLNAWCGGRPEYLFSEGEITSNELSLERQIEGVEKKTDWTRIRSIVLGTVIALATMCLVSFIILMFESTDELEIREEALSIINETSEYEGIEYYSDYLESAGDVSALAEVYIDAMDEKNSYFMEYINLSEYFVNATLILENEDGEEIESFDIDMLRPYGSVLGSVELSEYPASYRLDNPVYFKFNYNPLDFDVTFVDDYDEEYVWTDVVIDGANYSLENVKEALKRLYGECVISNYGDTLVYVYNTYTAESYEYDGVNYYYVDSADFMAYLLFEDKCIELYVLSEDSVELIDTIEME